MLQKHKIRIKIFIKTGIPKGCNSLWSFFWERWRFGGGKPVLSKKMGFPPPRKFASFPKLKKEIE